MEYYQIIANRIARLCKERSLSINMLAKMSNMRQSTIDNIMHGNSKNPGVQTLHKIALTFNMTIAEFLNFPELNDYSFDDDSEDDLLEE
ncbi:MAG: helix-turn-helix transcriptional regulator [Oscillibacter sp.]|nr:helix-turn-helix transcriptional regulator [Oscillibacter sp.]